MNRVMKSLFSLLTLTVMTGFSSLVIAEIQTAEQLSYIAQDKNNPRSERIDALEQLTDYPSQSALIAIARGLKDHHHDVREASVEASAPYKLEHRWRLLSPLMDDLVLDVRMAVAKNLVVDYSEMNAVQKQQFDPLFEDWASILVFQDSEQSLQTLAQAYSYISYYSKAREVYTQLIGREFSMVNAWLGIADSYRLEKKDKLALSTVNVALEQFPDEPRLLYSKALTLVRLGDKQEAATSMRDAAELAKDNSHYWYVNGVLQEPYDQKLALNSLKRAYKISGLPEQLYAVCDFAIRHHDNQAEMCVAKLEKIAPEHVVSNLRSRIDQRDVITQ